MADSAQLDERNRLARLLQQQRRRESRDAAAEHGDVDRQVTRKRGKANVRLRGSQYEPVLSMGSSSSGSSRRTDPRATMARGPPARLCEVGGPASG